MEEEELQAFKSVGKSMQIQILDPVFCLYNNHITVFLFFVFFFN